MFLGFQEPSNMFDIPFKKYWRGFQHEEINGPGLCEVIKIHQRQFIINYWLDFCLFCHKFEICLKCLWEFSMTQHGFIEHIMNDISIGQVPVHRTHINEKLLDPQKKNIYIYEDLRCTIQSLNNYIFVMVWFKKNLKMT